MEARAAIVMNLEKFSGPLIEEREQGHDNDHHDEHSREGNESNAAVERDVDVEDDEGGDHPDQHNRRHRESRRPLPLGFARLGRHRFFTSAPSDKIEGTHRPTNTP